MIERRKDDDRRLAVAKLACQTFNREVVRSLHHGEKVDPGALWDACIAQAVADTQWSPIPGGAR